MFKESTDFSSFKNKVPGYALRGSPGMSIREGTLKKNSLLFIKEHGTEMGHFEGVWGDDRLTLSL